MKQFKHKTLLARASMMLLAMLCFLGGARAQETLTVCDGTTTNSNIPVYGYSGDTQGTTSEFVIPATELEDLNGKEITALKFYVSSAAEAAWTATFQVYLKEIEGTTLSATTGPGNCTVVYTGSLDATGTTMDVVFDESFTYNGGNLLIGTYVQTAGNWKSATFYGVEATGAAYQSGGYNQNGAKSFIPKTTFTYETPSSCAKPTNLAVNYTSGATTATVTWSGEASSYNIDVNGTVTNGVTSPYTINNLQPATTYTVKLQSDCGDEQSVWALAGSFTTPCDAFVIPYAYGFEDANDIMCWNTIDCENDNTNGISGVVSYADYANTGSGFFAFSSYNGNVGPPQYLVSPILDVPTSGLHVEFWYRSIDDGYNETFKVGYSTEGNNIESFIWSEEITSSSATYTKFKANYPAETKCIAVQYTSDYLYYLLLDDFSFTEASSCLEPSSIVASDETTTSATISWTAGASEEAWDIFVTNDASIVPDETTTPTEANVATNSFNLTGLTPATLYYVYVRAICGEGEVSAWSSPGIFNTECNAMELPYNNGFEDGALSVCWTIIDDNASYNRVYINNSEAYTGTNHLDLRRGSPDGTQIVVLPEVDAAHALNEYQISFYAKLLNSSSSYGSGRTLTVGVMTDPTDASTFVQVGETITPTTSYSLYTVLLNSYTGNGQYLAIKHESTQYGDTYVDDLAVTELPSCFSPANLAVSNFSDTSVDLSWTANGSETEWTVYYKKTTDENYTEVPDVTDNPYTLSGLEAATAYQFYVVANCSETDESNPSEVYSFTTDCGAIASLPWTENFDTYSGSSSYSVPSGYPNDDMPLCWRFLNRSETSSAYPQVFISSNSGYPVSGKCLFFKSSDTTPLYAILPSFAEDIAGLQLTFTYRNEGTTDSNGTLIVGYMTDPTNAATFTAVLTCDRTTTLTEKEVLFTNAPTGSYIAFEYKGGTYNNYYLSIDNVAVDVVPDCLKPTDLSADNITTNSAELRWTANGSEPEWTVYYKKATDENYTEVTDVTENPYTITGLEAATVYQFYVVANCSETEGSAPSDIFTFTAKCEAIADFPWSEDFEDYSLGNFNETCWENMHISGNGSYIFKVSTSTIGSNTTHQLQLPDMTEGTLTKLVLPGMNLPNANYVFSIDVYRSNSTYNPDLYPFEGIRVFVSTNGDIEGATELAFIPRQYTVSSAAIPAETTIGWYTYNLPIGLSGTCYIILRGESQYCTSTYMDNFMVSEPTAIALSDDADNSTTISDNVDVLANITLANRTLFKDGTWNTFCVPFDVALANSPLAEAKVMELDVEGTYDGHQTGRDGETDNYYLFFKDASSIKAGKPYFVKWTTTGANISSPEFKGVTITTTTPTDIEATGITMKGNFSPVQVTANDMTTYFLMGDNKLYYTTVDRMLYNFRAYFKLDDASSAPNFTLGFDEGGTTRIFSIGKPQIEEGAWYDLNGRKYTEMPTAKGLYIHNGVKVIVK